MRNLEAQEGSALVVKHLAGEYLLEAQVIRQDAIFILIVRQRILERASCVGVRVQLFLLGLYDGRVFQIAVVLADFCWLARSWSRYRRCVCIYPEPITIYACELEVLLLLEESVVEREAQAVVRWVFDTSPSTSAIISRSDATPPVSGSSRYSLILR